MTTSSVPAADSDLDDLLEAIYRHHHQDFRRYARGSLARGVERARRALGVRSVAELTQRVVAEPATFTKLQPYLTIRVSELFRDPEYFRALREHVIPHLATYPNIHIWVAGCGTGEEAYSVAILLHEAGVLRRSHIYATDIDSTSLTVARAGAYEHSRIRSFSESYFHAGGRGSLSDYYVATATRATFGPMLRDRISFFDHSLATDAAFAEVHLVSCRNVFIYFDAALRERSIRLFRDSMCPRGFLGLGVKETLDFSPQRFEFEAYAHNERIYRLKRGSDEPRR